MSLFNLESFLEKIKFATYQEILSMTEEEVYRVEAMSSGLRGAPAARKAGSGQYAEDLKGLLFFLRYGKTPNGVSPETFALFRPIIESLVRREQMKPEALDPFGP